MKEEKNSFNIEELANKVVEHIFQRGIVNAKDLSKHMGYFLNGETATFNDVIKYCHEKGLVSPLYARRSHTTSQISEETYYTAPRRKS